MVENLSNLSLLVIFLLSSGIIWFVGVKITHIIDFITVHFGLGEAFGGMILLTIITNLPEVAITFVASYKHDYDIAISNIIGGIAIQTVVLVVIDIIGVGRKAPLTWKGHSRVLILEGISLIFILALVIIGKQFEGHFDQSFASPVEYLIVFIWITSVYLLAKLGLKEDQDKELIKVHHARNPKKHFKGSPTSAILLTIFGAILILIAGVTLEMSGTRLSNHFGINGVLFGGTILALCTALPEISTGIASAKIRDYNMAVSDIFGGNAFLPVLFFFASFLNGSSVLSHLSASNIYLACLGIILTGIYLVGMVLPSSKQIWRMGKDSLIVLVVYLIGLIGLWIIS
ncbi:sodium:calcium antiporter [Sandaracinomonas limnophila]|uniref:Sodium:calcium antiporter n=1 Tax=Sandaracinomonas limnophila TaxID=1862386 RepID=A0A437PP58_9BACT|nr:sodium:calcium antiporter [Sandaracinomonas limnophila]